MRVKTWNLIFFIICCENYSIEKSINGNNQEYKEHILGNNEYYDIYKLSKKENDYNGYNSIFPQFFTDKIDSFYNQYNDFVYMIEKIYEFFNKKGKSSIEDGQKREYFFEKNVRFNHKKRISKKNNNEVRKLSQVNSLLHNLFKKGDSEKYFCSGRGNILTVNYTRYHCENRIITKSKFDELFSNQTLFLEKNCSIKINQTDICICPKNLRGVECELETSFNCLIENLLVKNKTQKEFIDLMENKDTFYFEYINKPRIFYLDKEDNNFTLFFKVGINCTNYDDPNYNYTVTFGEIKEDEIETNLTDLITRNTELTKFNYFIEDGNLTVGFPMDIYLRFKIFDMNSVLPSITLYYPLSENFSKNNNKFRNIKKGNNNYDIFILNDDSIRNFICENFECSENQKIEDILLKNIKNKMFYNNFSINLMNYIKRKRTTFKESDFYYEDLINNNLKSSSVYTEQNEYLKNISNSEKEKIKKFLLGLENFEFELNLNKLNNELKELKNEFDLPSLVKGGRLFYEIEIVDDVNDYISDCIFQGEINYQNEFKEKSFFLKIFLIIVFVFILIFPTLMVYKYNKREEKKYQ